MDDITLILLVTTLLYMAVAFWFLVGLYKPHIPTKTSHQPFISVVIAVRNEEKYIANCLHALTQQTYPSDQLEVIIVNDESTDQTTQIVTTFTQKHPHFQLLSITDQYPHMAAKKRPMSVGILHAQGEWIVTTDADCQMPSTWLEQLSTYMQTDTDVIIGFSQIKTFGTIHTFFEKLQALDFLTLMSAAAGSANWGYALAATGQNFAYRKSLFQKVGGFEKIAHRPSGDDVLLLQLLRKATNNKIVFATHANTFASTHRPETPQSFWRQRKRWASNAAFQIRLNPIFFAYILVVFGIHALLPLSLLLSPQSYPVVAGCFLAKSLSDWLVVHKGAKVFNRTDLLSIWPVWAILNPLYIVLVGIFGTLGGFTWKDRHHS